MRNRLIALVVSLAAVFAVWAQEKTTPKPKGPADVAPIKELPPGKVLSTGSAYEGKYLGAGARQAHEHCRQSARRADAFAPVKFIARA